jgi:hypothetical protein
MRKSTMVELVQELEKITPQNKYQEAQINFMLKEAKAGEYHDYKNKKYACGKVAVSGYLREAGLIDLARRVENGEFDEEPDAEDLAMMKRDALAGGFTEEMCAKLFKL